MKGKSLRNLAVSLNLKNPSASIPDPATNSENVPSLFTSLYFLCSLAQKAITEISRPSRGPKSRKSAMVPVSSGVGVETYDPELESYAIWLSVG